MDSLQGTVGDDPKGTVSMQVTVKDGKAKKVKGFACQGLDGSCDDGSLVGEESGTFSGTTGAFPSPFRVFGPYDQAGSAGDIAPAAIGTSASP